MSQDLILCKLARFLELTNKDTTLLLCKDLRSEGHCQGFSICFAAMNRINQLEWWEGALKAIASWDENPETLQKKISLPKGDSNTTYAKIFARVLNYVVFNQADAESKGYKNIKLQNMGWDRMLKKKNPYFEILCPDKKIRHISNSKSAAGYFTVDQVNYLLNERLLSETMCFIYNSTHVITVFYKRPNWIIYDPNYDHNIPIHQSIHKKFRTKHALIREIMNIQGNSLGIIYATFEDDKIISLPQYENIIKLKSQTLLKQYGLEVICTYAASYLPTILKQAMKYKQTPSMIAWGLVAQDGQGWTGLQTLLYICPELLPTTLKYSSKSPRCAALLAEALATIEPTHHLTGLDMLLKHAPKYMPLILSYVEQSYKGKNWLAKALANKSKSGTTGLYNVVKYAPNYLMRILKYIADTKQAADSLAIALSVKGKEGKTGWDYVLSCNPLCKTLLLDILLKNIDSIEVEHLIKLQDAIKNSSLSKADEVKIFSNAFFKNNTAMNEKIYLKRILEAKPRLITLQNAGF